SRPLPLPPPPRGLPHQPGRPRPREARPRPLTTAGLVGNCRRRQLRQPSAADGGSTVTRVGPDDLGNMSGAFRPPCSGSPSGAVPYRRPARSKLRPRRSLAAAPSGRPPGTVDRGVVLGTAGAIWLSSRATDQHSFPT